MVLVPAVLGAPAGIVLNQIRRYPWPLQALLLMAVCSVSTFAWVGAGDEATRRPRSIGLVVATLIRPQPERTTAAQTCAALVSPPR